MASAKFCRTIVLVRRATDSAVMIEARPLPVNTRSDEARPISDPDAGAMDTCAALRAGASFRPSPTYRTL